MIFSLDDDPVERNRFAMTPTIRERPRSGTLTICCVIDRHPRFYVELVLWTLCISRHLPRSTVHPVVYFVDEAPPDLAEWLRAKDIEVRSIGTAVEGSPHCNKIGPFFDRYETDWTIVTDADLFFVNDPSDLLVAPRFRAPPNNHCNPPPHIFKSVLAATGMQRAYRPGIALYKGGAGMRETHLNNISGGCVAAPSDRAKALGDSWKKWARWLVDNRNLLGAWKIHVDQVAFALAMEDIGEDVEFLPPQTNTILQSFDEFETTYAFHLTTGHIPKFPARFNPDRTVNASGLSEGMTEAIEKLNLCIKEATNVISKLPSTRDHRDKFLNPLWRR